MRLIWPLLLVATLGCSIPGSPAPTPTPNLAAQYLKLVEAPNAAQSRLDEVATAKVPDLRAIQVAAQALIDADVKFNTGLLAMEDTASTTLRTHLETARSEISREIADLQQVTPCSDTTCAFAALNHWGNDYEAAASIFVLVRSDLGLPPPPAGSPTPT